VQNLGVRPDPFWDNQSIFSGLNAGEYSSPAPIPLNGTIAVCVYRLGLKTDFCHRGRSPRLVGCLAQLSELPVSDQEHQVRLILWLTAGSETTQASVTRS